MKLLCALSFIMVICSSTQAQVVSGKKVVGISGSLALQEGDEHYALFGRYGGSMADNMLAGIEASFNKSSVGNTHTRIFQLGPFVRYYLPGQQFRFFIGGFGAYANAKLKVDLQYGHITAFFYGPDAGLNVFINKNIAVELLLRYQFEKGLGKIIAAGPYCPIWGYPITGSG